ncbi:MAG: ELWxxDGT repeat protein [Planctomycetota bacterium]
MTPTRRTHRMPGFRTLAVLLGVLTAPLDAQFATGNSNPTGFSGGLFSSSHLFSASDGKSGKELWRTQPLANTTTQVLDIRPGRDGSFPDQFTSIPGNTRQVFFVAENGVNGRELWLSNGTPAGTFQVKDIRPGPVSSLPSHLTFVGKTLFFVAGTTTQGRELWKSDGTPAGTVIVKDIRPGTASSGPRSLIALGNKLLFVANDGTNGTELWTSDGTPAGTTMLKDIWRGAGHASPHNLVIGTGGDVFFAADDGTTGRELWRTNGTASGTVLVKDIRRGRGNSAPSLITPTAFFVFFTASNGTNGRELWRSDGTSAGTVLVKDIRPGARSSQIFHLSSNVFGVWFSANDGTSGIELWKSNGTASGTVRVKDIVPGSGSPSPRMLTPFGVNRLLFSADDGRSGRELWSSNGTASGTQLLTNIRPGSKNARPSYMHLGLGGTYALFSAENKSNGRELWMTNGTGTGTKLLADINRGGTGPELQIVASSRTVTLRYSEAVPTSIIATFASATAFPPTIIPGFNGYLRINPATLVSFGASPVNSSGEAQLSLSLPPPRTLRGAFVMQGLMLTRGPQSFALHFSDSGSVEANTCSVPPSCSLWTDGGWFDDETFDYFIPVRTDCPTTNTAFGFLALVLMAWDGTKFVEVLLDFWPYEPAADGNITLENTQELFPPASGNGFQVQLRWYQIAPATPVPAGCVLFQSYC